MGQAMATQKSNIPALRFPEFKEEWEETRLGKIGEFVSGIGFAESEQGGQIGVPFFKVSDMNLPENTHEMRVANNYVTESQIQKEKYKPINRKSIIFAKVGAAVFLERKRLAENFLIDNNMMAFLPNDDQRISFYRILFDRIRLSKYAQVGALPSYNSSDLKTIKLKLPIPKEQKKIADFLTAVDQKIAQLTEKKSCLEQYKKGVMQRLFTQPLRFHDTNGNPFPDWEEKKLGDIAKVYDGTHQTPDYVEQGIPFYSVEHITGKNFSDTKFISEEVYERECKKVKIEKGDILMTRIGDIGSSIHISWDVRASFYVSLALIKANKNYNSQFLDQYIKSENFQRELHRKTIHVAFPKKINLGEISECLVKLPSKPEQQKIADFLTAIDTKITVLGNQLGAAQDFKKSLLQKMFV